MRTFWSTYWWLWFAMLLVGDPIASWLGYHREKVGDQYTDTHLIVTHLNMGFRWAVMGWLLYHFLVLHTSS